jgi:hypothetical protein
VANFKNGYVKGIKAAGKKKDRGLILGMKDITDALVRQGRKIVSPKAFPKKKKNG